MVAKLTAELVIYSHLQSIIVIYSQLQSMVAKLTAGLVIYSHLQSIIVDGCQIDRRTGDLQPTTVNIKTPYCTKPRRPRTNRSSLGPVLRSS
jgi:hypothetical protein